MRRFGFNNILSNQANKPKDTSQTEAAGIDDNPKPETPIVQLPVRKYSAYRTILTRHNELSAKLHEQPAAQVTNEPIECEDDPLQSG